MNSKLSTKSSKNPLMRVSYPTKMEETAPTEEKICDEGTSPEPSFHQKIASKRVVNDIVSRGQKHTEISTGHWGQLKFNLNDGSFEGKNIIAAKQFEKIMQHLDGITEPLAFAKVKMTGEYFADVLEKILDVNQDGVKMSSMDIISFLQIKGIKS